AHNGSASLRRKPGTAAKGSIVASANNRSASPADAPTPGAPPNSDAGSGGNDVSFRGAGPADGDVRPVVSRRNGVVSAARGAGAPRLGDELETARDRLAACVWTTPGFAASGAWLRARAGSSFAPFTTGAAPTT